VRVCVCVCVCACVCLNLHEMLKCAHNPNVHLLSFPIARHVMLVFYLPCIVSLADMFCLNVFDYACRWLQYWDWLMGGRAFHFFHFFSVFPFFYVLTFMKCLNVPTTLMCNCFRFQLLDMSCWSFCDVEDPDMNCGWGFEDPSAHCAMSLEDSMRRVKDHGVC
jgi:hypothetical protein